MEIQEVKKAILDRSIRTKEKSDEFGEVFTPYHLIEDMLDLVNNLLDVSVIESGKLEIKSECHSLIIGCQ